LLKKKRKQAGRQALNDVFLGYVSYKKRQVYDFYNAHMST
jgi:hypothetical protein